MLPHAFKDLPSCKYIKLYTHLHCLGHGCSGPEALGHVLWQRSGEVTVAGDGTHTPDNAPHHLVNTKAAHRLNFLINITETEFSSLNMHANLLKFQEKLQTGLVRLKMLEKVTEKSSYLLLSFLPYK